MKERFEPVYLQGDFYSTCHVTKVNHRTCTWKGAFRDGQVQPPYFRERSWVPAGELCSARLPARARTQTRLGHRRCTFKKHRSSIRIYFSCDTSQTVFFWHVVYKVSMVQFLMPQATPFYLTRNMTISLFPLVCKQVWTYQIYLLSVVSILC